MHTVEHSCISTLISVFRGSPLGMHFTDIFSVPIEKIV